MPTVNRGGAVLLLTLAWTSGCHDSNGTATFPTSSPSPTTMFSLTGQVRSSDTGTSLAGATLSIVDGPNSGTSATSDMSGNYTFAALQGSVFTINVSAANHISQSLGVTLTSNRTLNFSLRPQPGAITLTGRVTDAAIDSPIPGAVVSINGRYRGTTDNSGHYTVAGLLDYGSGYDYTYVSAENYFPDYRYIKGRTVQNAPASHRANCRRAVEASDDCAGRYPVRQQRPGFARHRSGLSVQKRVGCRAERRSRDD